MIAASLLCLVVAIADGDTLTVRCGHAGAYKQLTVRLSAIDAPEMHQPSGRSARQALADLCFRQQARVTPRAVDPYQRTVADVECRGRDAGRQQVRTGMAWVYTAYARGRSGLPVLQRAARAEGIGLWSDRKPMPPWQWRRVHQDRSKTR